MAGCTHPPSIAPSTAALLTARKAKKAEEAALAGKAALKAAAAEDGATQTESGLVIKTLIEGSGASPTADDTVEVHYEGTLVDGTVFDSSYKRGTPTTFAPNQVIKGWTEGLQLMRVGGKAKLTIPSDLAYGAKGAGSSVPPHATLIFEVELLGIVS